MSSNRLCKNCGKTFEVIMGKKKKDPTCSDECKEELAIKIKACKPWCDESTLFSREVFFKDGTNHLQQACTVCLKTKLLPKIWGINAGIIDQQVDFITDAAKSFV